ncbi:hypothetical protein [Oryzobacter telluris]|uniref:hypothetical protein n=1 Tax=Oryzobacter telluris TaxID=3149179 RepID=UPI00370D08CB
MTPLPSPVPGRTRHAALAVGLATGLVLASGCTSEPAADAGTPTASSTPVETASTGGPEVTGSPEPSPTKAPPSISPVLPVKQNPIANTSTVKALAIEKVLVEDNKARSGKDAPDHLEITLRNTGSAALTAFEVFYTFRDPKTKEAESYYVALPASFTIPAGGRRLAHFDTEKGTDHFPVNKFSLYYTDRNALDVAVEVAAVDAATAKATTKKDAGGAEEAD